MSLQKRITLTVSALLIAVALVEGAFISQYIHKEKKIDASQFHGTLLEKPREINQFVLTGTDNKAFTNASLQGHWTLVFFGFTNCGYLCPTTMAELAKMYRVLVEKDIKPLPRIVMISIDSERDSLNKLDHYVKAFHSQFYGAKGDEETLKKMTREMGIAYVKVTAPNAGNAENYDIQHSGAVMLFNSQGELNAFFTTPHQASLLVKDYQLLVS